MGVLLIPLLYPEWTRNLHKGLQLFKKLVKKMLQENQDWEENWELFNNTIHSITVTIGKRKWRKIYSSVWANNPQHISSEIEHLNYIWNNIRIVALFQWTKTPRTQRRKYLIQIFDNLSILCQRLN
jgi:hypothetical protein